jgi:hypothetical protein
MRFARILLAAAGLVAAFAAVPAAAQDDGLVWQYSRHIDADVFKTRLVLTYSKPETDLVQFVATCEIGANRTYAVAEIGADIGNLQDGAPIDVEFRSGGFRTVASGEVVGTNREEGIAGATLVLELDDPLWSAIRGLSELRYKVAGFQTLRLSLRGSSGPTQAFLRDCKDIPGPDDVADQQGQGQGPAPASALPTFNDAPAPRPATQRPATVVAPPPPPPAPPAPGNSQAISCSAFGGLKSVGGGQPTAVTFINRSDGYRSVMWLDYSGTPKPYRNLNPGEAYTQETAVGHPWMITDGPGNCLEIYMPVPGGSVFNITAPNQNFGAE